MNKEYNITVKEPWFTLIKMKLKSVEGRLNKGLFSKFKKDDIVNWVKITNNKKHIVKTKIVSVNKYNSFKEMLQKETLKRTLPGIPTVNCGVEVYRQYFSENFEKKYGVVAIQLEVLRQDL